MFQGRQHRLPSRRALDIAGSARTLNSEISSFTPTISLSASETTHDGIAGAPTTNSDPEPAPISSQPKSEHPEFSVEYNPEVKQVLELHLEHVFTHESPAWCAKISPDGQRMAVGFQSSGATVIRTKSNVRSVSGCIVGALD